MISASNICTKCKRRSHLIVTCKCSNTFCLKCKSPEIHSCTFDYMKEHTDLLAKNNPMMISKKLDKI